MHCSSNPSLTGLGASSSSSRNLLLQEHWTRSSEARAKLANRHRRTVGLKPGDRVVWNSEGPLRGGGSCALETGSDGPLPRFGCQRPQAYLGAHVDGVGGTSSARRGPMEAHAEDCILVPEDADGAESREPVVFEDDEVGGDDSSRPSLRQQVQGEAKQVEFTLTLPIEV